MGLLCEQADFVSRSQRESMQSKENIAEEEKKMKRKKKKKEEEKKQESALPSSRPFLSVLTRQLLCSQFITNSATRN